MSIDPHAHCVDADHDTDATGAEPGLQVITSIGELACNHCGSTRSIAYCRRTDDYVHLTDPEIGCFLIPARPNTKES